MNNFHEFTYSDCQIFWRFLEDTAILIPVKQKYIQGLHPINFALFCEYLSKNRGEVASDYIKTFFQ